MIRLRDIKKPPARCTRIKASSIPMTGELRTSLEPKRPAWIRWHATTSGIIPIRIPGFMTATAPRGHVPEGSPEEEAMKLELGL